MRASFQIYSLLTLLGQMVASAERLNENPSAQSSCVASFSWKG